jgi:hypothetical protein
MYIQRIREDIARVALMRRPRNYCASITSNFNAHVRPPIKAYAFLSENLTLWSSVEFVVFNRRNVAESLQVLIAVTLKIRRKTMQII